jgi:hypothetical protein
VGLAVEDMPAIAGGDDHELVKIMLVQRKRWLRRARLDAHELRLPAEELAPPKLQQDHTPRGLARFP